MSSDTFFSAGYYFSQVFPCKLFSPRNQSAGYFFSENTHNPLKSQVVDLLYPPNICSVDSDLSIISKAFSNNGERNSLGERG